MKSLRIIVPLAIVVVGVIVALYFRPLASDPQFATASECVDAFYNAVLDDKPLRIRNCLSPALQNKVDQFVASKRDLSAFPEVDQKMIDEDSAMIVIDEVRAGSDQAQRYAYDVQRIGGDWKITAISAPKWIKLNVPSGTAVNEAPDP